MGEKLRNALYEMLTNGRWTEGEQRGEWAVPAEVYAMAQEAIEVSPAAPQVAPEGWPDETEIINHLGPLKFIASKLAECDAPLDAEALHRVALIVTRMYAAVPLTHADGWCEHHASPLADRKPIPDPSVGVQHKEIGNCAAVTESPVAASAWRRWSRGAARKRSSCGSSASWSRPRPVVSKSAPNIYAKPTCKPNSP